MYLPDVQPHTYAQNVYYDIVYKESKPLRTKTTTVAAVKPTATGTDVKNGVVKVEFNVPLTNTLSFGDIWVSGGKINFISQSADGKTVEVGIENLYAYHSYYIRFGNAVIDGKTVSVETKTFVPSHF
ncbi:MAG: hypothetical protein RR651_00300 [Lysinibacillus sp.]